MKLPKIVLIDPRKKQLDGQYSDGKRAWSAARLAKLYEDEPVYEVPVRTFPLYDWHWEEKLTLFDFLVHCKRINAADLSKPILIGPDGAIVDGVHRLCKAILAEEETVKVIYIPDMPTPDRFKS